MGIRYCYEINAEIPNTADREMIYSLDRGEISEVISTIDGWTFFRAEERLVKADFFDTAVMDRVRYYVRNYQRGRMEDWAIEQAKDFISEARGVGVASAARWRNLAAGNFGPFPLNYGGIDLFKTLASTDVSGADSPDLQGLSLNENFWKIAFSTPIDIPCEPLVQGSVVYVFIPTEEIKADEYSIDNIASMYSSNYVTYTTDRSLQGYFMKSKKMEDNFDEVYYRFFQQTSP
jgi:hypothetical protein